MWPAEALSRNMMDLARQASLCMFGIHLKDMNEIKEPYVTP